MVSIKDQAAILENRINTLENRGKATPRLIKSLKRELRNKQAQIDSK